MSNKKNKEKIKERLGRSDNDKSAGTAFSSVNNNLFEKYTKARGNVSSVFAKKSKFPIGLDIFISVLLVLIVAALVVGAYFLIIRFDDAYDNETVEYVLLVEKNQIEGAEKGNDIYVDKDGAVIFCGSIVNIEDSNFTLENSDVNIEYALVTVRADVQFRDDEGFSIDEEKIAVGRTMTVRVKDTTFTCDIVELTVLESKKK